MARRRVRLLPRDPQRPPTIEQARRPWPEGFMNAYCTKYFAPSDQPGGWPGGLAKGWVEQIDDEYALEQGGPIIRELLFVIRYEDGEPDDVDWQEFCAIYQGSEAAADAAVAAAQQQEQQQEQPVTTSSDQAAITAAATQGGADAGNQPGGGTGSGSSRSMTFGDWPPHQQLQLQQQQQGVGPSGSDAAAAAVGSSGTAAGSSGAGSKAARISNQQHQQALLAHAKAGKSGKLPPSREEVKAMRRSPNTAHAQPLPAASGRQRRQQDRHEQATGGVGGASRPAASVATSGEWAFIGNAQAPTRKRAREATEPVPQSTAQPDAQPSKPRQHSSVQPGPQRAAGSAAKKAAKRSREDDRAPVQGEQPHDPGIRTPPAKQARHEVLQASAPPAPPSRPPKQRQRAQEAGPHRQPSILAAQAGSADLLREEIAGDAGRLLRIELRDFMCHPHLAVEFGHNVTLISGANGSGKSAIMQALQAALGVAARSTGRGTSLKGYVRTGAPSAHITVVLDNTGPERVAGCMLSGSPIQFGKEIVIQRRINADGGGWYKLGKPKEEKQAKKEDVDMVLDQLNINAANPLTVITQDKARTFLADTTNDKKTKYEMFMDGTLLGVTLDSLSVSGKQLEEAQALLVAADAQLDDERVYLEKQKKAAEKLEELQRAAEEARLIEQAMGWLLYQEECLGVARLETQHKEGVENLAMVQKAIDELQGQLTAAEAKISEVREVLRSWNEAVSSQVERQKQLKQAVKDARLQRKAAEAELTRAEAEVALFQSQLQHVQQQLAQDHSAQAEAHRQALQAAQAKADAANRAVRDAEAAYQEAERQVEEARDHRRHAQAAAQQADAALRDASNQVAGMQQQLINLQESARDPVHLFGGSGAVRVKAMLQEPQYARQFATPPIGPVGSYIKIKASHERWRRAADAVLSPILDTWIVGSMRDMKTLRDMACTAGMDVRKLSIAVVNLRVPPHRLPPDAWPEDREAYPLVIDAVDIEGDDHSRTAVWNHMLDKSRATVTVMVPKVAEARKVVYAPYVLGAFHNSGTQPVANYSAVTTEGELFSAGATVKVEHRRSPRLVKSVAAELDARSQHLQVAQQQLDAHQQAAAAAQAAVVAATEAERSREFARKAAHSRRLKAQQAFDKARAEVEAQGDAFDPATQLASQLVELNRGLSDCVAQQASAAKRLQDCNAAVAVAAAALESDASSHAQQSTTYQQKVEGMEALVGKEVPALKALLARRQKLLSDMRSEMGRLQQDLAQRQAHLDDALATLTQDCPMEEGAARVAQVEALVRQRVEAQAMSYWKARNRRAQQQQQQQEGTGHPARTHVPSAEELQEVIEEVVAEQMSISKLQVRMEQQYREHAAAEQQAGGNLAEVKYEVEKLQERCDKRVLQWQNVYASIKLLSAGLTMRWESYQTWFEKTEDTVQRQFHKLLARRNHIGRIKIDANAETLSLEVRVNGVLDPNAPWQTDLKQLSGGERSLVTVAFLLAVGSQAQSPFRCMDEFDVFMDAVNRLVATETLLENAFDNKSQYIFLTPQDVEGVLKAKHQLEARRKLQVPDDFLLVKKLHKPRA